MNLDIIINKNTCFYYWVQVISNWDPYPIDPKAYQYPQDRLKIISNEQKSSLNNIKNILQSSKESRWILAELYSGDIKRSESKEIEELSKKLIEVFEAIWQESLPHLEVWLDSLKSTNFARFNEPMKKIVDFLDSDFNLQDLYTLYLLQNSPFSGAIGHAINNTRFILVCPPGSERPNTINNTISIIAHEYTHAVEFKSKISRTIFKNSYDKYIGKHNIPEPDGYSWKMMYIESLVCCFANTITGGYLRPETYQKPRPTIDEMENSFRNIKKEGRYNTNHIINWAALNILPDVEEHIEKGIKFDQQIADKLSKIFMEFYLT